MDAKIAPQGVTIASEFAPRRPAQVEMRRARLFGDPRQGIKNTIRQPEMSERESTPLARRRCWRIWRSLVDDPVARCARPAPAPAPSARRSRQSAAAPELQRRPDPQFHENEIGESCWCRGTVQAARAGRAGSRFVAPRRPASRARERGAIKVNAASVPIARLAIEAKIHRAAREMQPPWATSERLSFVKPA